ncbi:unnamed protein product [Pleuronectes platessa]|uniref:Uncharacterized protein n=1 Tax=Pleuronectes platessa TaxID=8262 RepID=A0A9N7Y7Z9_PLEPL|nr:unnamed protein product [Pleuronectes platessa]
MGSVPEETLKVEEELGTPEASSGDQLGPRGMRDAALDVGQSVDLVSMKKHTGSGGSLEDAGELACMHRIKRGKVAVLIRTRQKWDPSRTYISSEATTTPHSARRWLRSVSGDESCESRLDGITCILVWGQDTITYVWGKCANANGQHAWIEKWRSEPNPELVAESYQAAQNLLIVVRLQA